MNRREAEELRRRIDSEPDCRFNGMSDRDTRSEDGIYVVVVFKGGATYNVETPEEFEQLLEQHRG